MNFSSSSPSKPMSKLATLKKQIAALEAQAERIAKEEMSSAIAKVKDIMAEYNLTIEHLTLTAAGKRAAKKKMAKVKTTSVAKYVDPKTGKTWSGFGRAPGWIAGAKNRDAFLVGKSATAGLESKTPAAAKKASGKVAKVAKKAAKPAAKKAVAPVKKASIVKAAPTAAKKKPAAKKASAKKSASKRAASKRAAVAPVELIAAPAA